MPDIISTQRIVTRERIEPCDGHTPQSVCDALNQGFAMRHRLCPAGLAPMHDCTHPRVIVMKMDRGQPDESRIIASISGSSGFNSGQIWRPATVEEG